MLLNTGTVDDNVTFTANLERMQRTLAALSGPDVGGTAGGGVDRPALSDADKRVRDRLADLLTDLGLEVRVDDAGSMFGRRPGAHADAAPVLIGSHLDTVSPGGRFDGIVGVVAALEAVELLNEASIETYRPIDVVNWTGEEGARFAPALLASGLVAGTYDIDFVYSRRDPSGHSFGEELERIGYHGRAENRPSSIHASLELHIEQGVQLEEGHVPLGVVSGIEPVRWLQITVRGRGEHAGGPGPLHRRDSAVAAARMVVAARDLAVKEQRFKATVGQVAARPGSTNVVPNTTTFSLDLRARTDAQLDEAVRQVEQTFVDIAAEEQVTADVVETWRLAATAFDRSVRSQLMAAAEAEGVDALEVYGGIGHDSLQLAQVTRAAMLFTPTVNGLSHCEEEDSPWDATHAAAAVLTRVLYQLANEP